MIRRSVAIVFILGSFGLQPGARAETPHGAIMDEVARPADSSPNAIRAATVNRYIGDAANLYNADYFRSTNDSGKISLKMLRPESALGTFSEYGSLSIDAKGPAGKDGAPLFLHYNGLSAERDGRDTWAEPQTVCATLVYAAEWKARCIEKYGVDSAGPCTLQLGDLSMPNKKLNSSGRCALGHKSHYRGNCIDIRPVSPTKLKSGAVTNSSDPATVARTKEALDFAVAMGGTNPIWQSAGHFDHYHVCFPLGKTSDASLGSAIKNGPLAGCYGLR